MFFSKTDALGTLVQLDQPPLRIVSLVPSQTELLFDLGLSENIVGITNFCVHPKTARKEKKIIGGTKKIHFNRIQALKPDLVIANKEENLKDDVEQLKSLCPVYTTEIKNLEDALHMITELGILTNRTVESKKILKEIKKSREEFEINKTLSEAVYLIWKNPYMTAGGDTYINEMMKEAGFSNLFSTYDRYPEVSIQSLKEQNPEYLLLSSEPYPFKQKDVLELQRDIPGSKIILVDGEMFSWYGSRIQQAFGYFQTLKSSKDS